jgi:hypothetical protein
MWIIVWEYQTFAALASLELWKYAFAKPIFDPINRSVFRVYIFCVRIWRSTLMVIHRHDAFLSWLTPPFSYGRRNRLVAFRQKYSEASVCDIKVVVYDSHHLD